ncbi:MAG: hypothetical protein PHR27_10870, partial [Candidatus Cloacimonetes bacterium]|nr:hypothetical protein [Candidatus Cloacimonadota bacterium]
MAYVDNELFLMQDANVGATMTSSVVEMGSKGGFNHPLYFDVKLTKAMTSGTMSTIKVQSSDKQDFSTNVATEVEITVPGSIVQTAGPATLAQFYAPIKLENKFIRLVITGTSPVG